MIASVETSNGSLKVRATDVSRQKTTRISNLSSDSTVSELIGNLLPKMDLPGVDRGGRPIAYTALLPREGRHLFSSERVGDALVEDDEIVLEPSVDAG